MTRLRAQFSHILSAFATLRLIRAVINRIRGIDPSFDDEWSRNNEESQSVDKQGVKWPILVYTGLTVAAPFLMWKLVSSFAMEEGEENAEDESWAKGKSEHFVAVAEHDFNTARNGEEIPLRIGEQIIVAPKERQPRVRGWLLGSKDGGKTIGLFPANYVKILGRKTPDNNSKGPPDVVANINHNDDDFNDAFGT